MNVAAKRAYEEADESDGERILVDRLWPRGVSKERAQIDVWAKDVTPSNALRKWFHADPEKRFAEFTKRYAGELAASKALVPFRKEIKGKKKITLVSAAKDLEHSHVALLLKRLR